MGIHWRRRIHGNCGIWVSASLVLVASRRFKFTFPVFAVGSILASFVTITLILDITVPKQRCQHDIQDTGGKYLTCHPGCESGLHHDLDDRSLGLDLGVHPCEGKSHHHVHVEGMGSDHHGEENDV